MAPVYEIVIERSSNGFGAWVPDLPGCVAVAETEAEVRTLIEEAIAFHLEALDPDHYEIPAPSSARNDHAEH